MKEMLRKEDDICQKKATSILHPTTTQVTNSRYQFQEENLNKWTKEVV